MYPHLYHAPNAHLPIVPWSQISLVKLHEGSAGKPVCGTEDDGEDCVPPALGFISGACFEEKTDAWFAQPIPWLLLVVSTLILGRSSIALCRDYKKIKAGQLVASEATVVVNPMDGDHSEEEPGRQRHAIRGTEADHYAYTRMPDAKFVWHTTAVAVGIPLLGLALSMLLPLSSARGLFVVVSALVGFFSCIPLNFCLCAKKKAREEQIQFAEEKINILREEGWTAGDMGAYIRYADSTLFPGVWDYWRRQFQDSVERPARDCVVSFPGGVEWAELLELVHARKLADAVAFHRLLATCTIQYPSPTDQYHPVQAPLKVLELNAGGVETSHTKVKFQQPIVDLADALAGELLWRSDTDLACVFVSGAGDFMGQSASLHPRDPRKVGVDVSKRRVGTAWTRADADPPVALEIERPLSSNPSGKVEPNPKLATHEMSFEDRLALADCTCYCARLGSLNSDVRCGYQTADGRPRQGDDGCAWFEAWLANVEFAASAGATLHVIQKCHQSESLWTDGVPLGHAQCLEVMTLELLGLSYETHSSPTSFIKWLEGRPSAAARITKVQTEVEEQLALLSEHREKQYLQGDRACSSISAPDDDVLNVDSSEADSMVCLFIVMGAAPFLIVYLYFLWTC